MAKIAIVYYSGTNHTHLMAEGVLEGCRAAGHDARLLRIADADVQSGRFKNELIQTEVQAADAVIFGSPTYMGGVAAQFKAFADWSSKPWFAQAWRDKLAAGFTHSGAPLGDKGETLHYFVTLALQQGMVWVGTGFLPGAYTGADPGLNRLGSFAGAAGQQAPDPTGKPATELDPADRATAVKFGRRVGDALTRWAK